jgi:hypothetical protein
MNAIIKAPPIKQLDPNAGSADALILAYWILYGSRPSNPEPEPDGSYFIGTVEEPRLQDQRLLRETPYSRCAGIRR